MVLSRAGARAVFTRACFAAACLIVATSADARQLAKAEVVARIE